MRTRLLINHFDISIADELFVRDSFCGGLIMRFIFKIFEVDQEIYGNVLFLYSTVLVFCNVKVYKYAAIMDKEQNMDTLKKLKLKIQIHGYLRKWRSFLLQLKQHVLIVRQALLSGFISRRGLLIMHRLSFLKLFTGFPDHPRIGWHLIVQEGMTPVKVLLLTLRSIRFGVRLEKRSLNRATETITGEIK
uniref:Uncharacterized protein n=1 Tax=Lactuca sativa TaxID=4236 RepID=A0A9R1XHW2_LACSA|nr:hypothetical protein LSAT_V11C500290950 [Lactuca sativa]